MSSKICTKCGTERDITEFAKRTSSKDGRAPSCKKCRKLYDSERYKQAGKLRYLTNKDNRAKSCRKWRSKNPGYIRRWRIKNCDYDKLWRENNKEKMKEYIKKNYNTHKARSHARSAAYRARKLQQIPNLSELDRFKIQKIYELRSFMNLISTNIKWHVDHIKPLKRGGLHHPDNLRILESTTNLKKGCKLI